MVRQGIRVPTTGRPQDTAEFARRVEAAGFDFMWIPDTPWLAGRWRDVYVHLTASALATERIRLGPGVTNPMTRHPITTGSAIQGVNDASDGRADLVVGTGYSSAYIIGRKAATLASMRAAITLWRQAFSGGHTDLPGSYLELTPSCPDLPIYMAASGPKALQLAGEVADGVLIMVGAAAGTVGWALDHVEQGMARAGRARSEVERIVVVTARVDEERERAIAQMRPCAASLFRHPSVKVMLESAGVAVPDEIPALPFVYPDVGHAVDWEQAKAATHYVPDAAVEALIALGSADEVALRARELMALDIDALWWRDEGNYTQPRALMTALSEEVFPRLSG